MIERVTHLSDCRRYRFTLWREWDCDLLTGCADDLPNVHKPLMVIGLNPSTADETKDDPTIRKCIGFAKRLGFGSLCMTNLFAFRATQPNDMKAVGARAIGEENNAWLQQCAAEAGMILAAWGKDGSHLGRDKQVAAMFPNLVCLGNNNDGSPKHPLYVPYEAKPVPFKIAA